MTVWRRIQRLGAAALATAMFAQGATAGAAEIAAGAALGVKAGMTLAEAKAAAPDLAWRYEPRFMVDFSAACAERDGAALFCALVYENPKETPTDRIETIAVLSPDLATERGVRVGMSVAAAEVVYGAATLAFSWENEGREHLFFAAAPDWMNFRAVSARSALGHAGLYPEAPSDVVYHETTDYAEDAVIEAIWLY